MDRKSTNITIKVQLAVVMCPVHHHYGINHWQYSCKYFGCLPDELHVRILNIFQINFKERSCEIFQERLKKFEIIQIDLRKSLFHAHIQNRLSHRETNTTKDSIIKMSYLCLTQSLQNHSITDKQDKRKSAFLRSILNCCLTI